MRTKKHTTISWREPNFVITFKKYLLFIFLNMSYGRKGQMVFEYVLLMVVIAILSIAIIWPHISKSDNNIFTNAVNSINERVMGVTP